MSKINSNRFDKDDGFLKRLDALTGSSEDRDSSTVKEQLRERGVDPDLLRKAAYDRLRQSATQRYSSQGKNVPPQMVEALRQLRPPTPEEEEQTRTAEAASKVQSLLDHIKAGIAAVVDNNNEIGDFAPAFRNKKGQVSRSDSDLLNSHQSELDSEWDTSHKDD